MNERSARAWTEAMAVEPIGHGRYSVDSQSGKTYVVNLRAGECTCPDHRIRKVLCKHVRRVAIEVNRGEVPPPGKIAAECAACGREAFLPEDAQPPLCSDCHLKPGDAVRDRVTGDLVVVVRVTNARADQVRIDEANHTVASYPSNRDFPDDDPVVEVVYPFSADNDVPFEDLPRYSFPRSRLERQDEQIPGPGTGRTRTATVD